MCGIAGTTKNKKLFSEEVLATMRHRGPDASGFYNEDVKLFHSRLAIIDLDSRSNQPLWSSDGKVAVVFNGEIYNFKDLRKSLEKKYVFTTTSDTEVILYGYREWGNDVWSKLEGMFAVSVYDKRNQKIILAKDHASIKPLWYRFKNGLTWASELKTLAKIEKQTGDELTLNPPYIPLFVAFGYVPAPHSLFEEVFQLEASSYLEYEINTGKSKITKYANNVATKSSLLESVEDSILSHLVADVPVGLFFSGGMDSSLIAAVLKKHDKNLKSFSLRMPGRTHDQEFSEKIALHLGLDNTFFDFDQAAFDESYDDVTKNIDTPLADVALFSNSYVAKQAAKEVKVVLSGEGGDELFFGYPRQRNLYNGQSSRFWGNVMVAYLAFPHHKYKGYIFQNFAKRFDAPSYYVGTCSPLFNFLSREYLVMAQKQLSTHEPIFYDRDLYLGNMLLQKLDFVTMQFSIEGRVPLLSKQLFAESENRKDFFSPNSNDSKPELKKVLLELLPRDLVERPKSGFGFRVESFVCNNDQVRDDLKSAVSFLSPRFLNIPPNVHETNPTAVLPLILLYKSISNVLNV